MVRDPRATFYGCRAPRGQVAPAAIAGSKDPAYIWNGTEDKPGLKTGPTYYLPGLRTYIRKCCDVSTRGAGAGREDEASIETSSASPRAEAAPISVKP